MKKKVRKKAAALRYDPQHKDAPTMLAKGRGQIADKIIALAKSHDIPLYEDRSLVEALEALELNTEIPPAMYRAVAEVLVFIYRLNLRQHVPIQKSQISRQIEADG
jgi:flagellar biosynthesis protein